MKKLLPLLLYVFSFSLMAHEDLPKKADISSMNIEAPSSYLSVADNIKAMDVDHDGIVSVHEMRAYIESKHGEGYKQSLFDAMEASANSRSCGSPFSGSLY